MKFLSLGTLIGIIAGFGLCIYAVVSSTDNYIMFLSPASLMMVVGGTFAASMIAYQERYVGKALKDMFSILIHKPINPKTLFADVGNVIEWSKIIRTKGINGIEEETEAMGKNIDPFTKFGADLLITGYEGYELRQLLTDFMDSMYERSMIQPKILQTMSAFAPAFGMIGTLVGLIIMLDNMGGDPSALGKGLSIALLTTLYGVLLAQLIFKPSYYKLKQKHDIIRFRNNLLLEGFVMLAAKTDSITIQDKLNSFLDPQMHYSIFSDDDQS